MAAKHRPAAYRVRFVYDHDASFEESNGEPRPLTEEEYAENKYRACPDHMRAALKVVDASTTPPTVGCAECGRTDYVDIPYDEYLAYYGNPDAHVYLGAIVETKCACCDHWHDSGESLWHIDVMEDSDEYESIRVGDPVPAMDAIALPNYLGDVSIVLLSEAGCKAAKDEARKRWKAQQKRVTGRR